MLIYKLLKSTMTLL